MLNFGLLGGGGILNFGCRILNFGRLRSGEGVGLVVGVGEGDEGAVVEAFEGDVAGAAKDGQGSADGVVGQFEGLGEVGERGHDGAGGNVDAAHLGRGVRGVEGQVEV